MNTKKLVAGQDVWITLGQRIFQKGKVLDHSFLEQFVERRGKVDVPSKFAEGAVAVEVNRDCARSAAGYTVAPEGKERQVILFDANGKAGPAWEGLGFFDYSSVALWFMDDPRSPGNWELVDGEPPKELQRHC